MCEKSVPLFPEHLSGKPSYLSCIFWYTKWIAGFQRVRSSKCHPRFSSMIKCISPTRLHVLNLPNGHFMELETANTSMNILASNSKQILDGREEIIIYTFAHTHMHACTNAHIFPHWRKLWMWGGRWLTMLTGRQDSLQEENPVYEGDTCMHIQVQTNPAIFLA